MIDAAEAAYFQARGRYAEFEELVRSGQIQQTLELRPQYSKILTRLDLGDPQPLKGFTLTVTLSPPNSSGYHVYLIQHGDGCSSGWFTDESGVVSVGRPVTCGEGLVRDWAPLNVDAAVPTVRDDSPCPLPQILHETSERASELVQNLQRFSATMMVAGTPNSIPATDAQGEVSFVNALFRFAAVSISKCPLKSRGLRQTPHQWPRADMSQLRARKRRAQTNLPPDSTTMEL